jgi:hypothetical protein
LNKGKGMKLRTLAVLVVIAAFCCAGCLQELPLGDKYINEAVGLLRVQNTSTEKSYVITAVELRNNAGEVIKTWEGLGKDGQGLQKDEIWTGDLDLEGSFILYCTVLNKEEGTTGTFSHGAVEIKLHEVADSGITGDLYLSTADTDKDGFSDFWENAHKDEGFNPEDPSDGGTVYVSSAVKDKQLGTEEYPYFTLAAGVEKAMYGLTEEARTVVVIGTLNRKTEAGRSTDTAVFSIDGTGLHGVTIEGRGESSVLDAESSNNGGIRALFLGPGTKLTLKNITITRGWGYRGGGIHAKGAELTLGEGTVIQDCGSDAGGSSGGGLYAGDGAVVLMESGSLITKNKGLIGAAVALLNGASLTMQNGSRITGNQFDRGGAVAADLGSRITLEPGAEITGNTNNYNPQFKNFFHGGGVRLTGGSTLLMKGGLISGNTLYKNDKICGGGGGVYVGLESVLDMRDGEISGNIVGKAAESEEKPAVLGNGGGVYVDTGGVFNMSGGTIASNTATDSGGGVYVDKGNFYKTGGTVYGSGNSGNTAGTGYAQPTTGKGHAFYGETGYPVDNTLKDSFSF